MSFGSEQTSRNALFARYLAAAQAGATAGHMRYDPSSTADEENEADTESGQQTQPYAVITNTEIPGYRWLSAAQTNLLYVENGTSISGLPLVSHFIVGGYDLAYDLTGADAAITLVGGTFSPAQIGSTPNLSAFGQVDDDRERRSILEAMRALVVLPAGLGHNVESRLQHLIAVARDEGPETAGPAPDSVRALVNFLSAISAKILIRLPSIALDGEGLLVCEWRNEDGESAILRFLNDGRIGCAFTTTAIGRLRHKNSWFGVVSTEEARSTVVEKPTLRQLIQEIA